jgi:ferrous iron transport protein B
MHHLGLHGKSFLPLSLGFGCNVPAVMGARVIDSPSSRLITILLVPFVPCSARLLVLTFLTPIFFGEAALSVAVAFVSVNLVLLTVTGIVLSHTLFRGQQAFFIMEMPEFGKLIWPISALSFGPPGILHHQVLGEGW